MPHDIEAAAADDQGLGALDGPGSGGVASWPSGKRLKQAYERHRSRCLLSDRRGGQDLIKIGRQGEVRRDHRDRDESRHRSAPCRPERARRRHACRTAPARTCASRCSRKRRQGRSRRRPPAPTWSAPRTLRKRCRAAKIEFDRCIATPDMMARGRPARQGAGPARPDAESEARHRHQRRRRGGARRPRAARSSSAPRRPASIHAGVGKASFTEQAIDRERRRRFVGAVSRAKPSGAKGHLYHARCR